MSLHQLAVNAVCCILSEWSPSWRCVMPIAACCRVRAMGSSTACWVALLATCLFLQNALAQRGGGSMIGYGSGSSDEGTGTGTGRGRGRAGRGGSSSRDGDDSDTMATTLGSELLTSLPIRLPQPKAAKPCLATPGHEDSGQADRTVRISEHASCCRHHRIILKGRLILWGQQQRLFNDPGWQRWLL